jgi:hypothetical protein
MNGEDAYLFGSYGQDSMPGFQRIRRFKLWSDVAEIDITAFHFLSIIARSPLVIVE